MREVRPPRDYAPTRTGFRIRRLLRDQAFQKFATVWAPLLLVLAGIGWVASQSELRNATMAKFDEMKNEALERPEFAVTRLSIEGAAPDVEAALRRQLEYTLGASSLTFDATRARRRVEALGWVRSAQARLEAPRTLNISVTLRQPALIWRRGEALTLLDATGAAIARLESRAEHPGLPLIAGVGANTPKAVNEAIRIFKDAGALGPRLRGLVRIGERRWNAVLNDGPVVMLPAKDALDALAYVKVLEQTPEKPLTKDVTAIDLRIRGRPTLRLGPDALQSLHDGRNATADGEDA
jgi:cell division protein FtsQ